MKLHINCNLGSVQCIYTSLFRKFKNIFPIKAFSFFLKVYTYENSRKSLNKKYAQGRRVLAPYCDLNEHSFKS